MPVFSVYPDIPGISAIKNAMHGICYPRQRLVDDSSPSQEVDPIHIMWTRAAPSQLRGWRPNHFVPLLIQPDDQRENIHEFLSFSEVVRRGRKRLQQFSYPKEEENEQENFYIKPSPLQRTPVRNVDDINRKQADVSSPPKKAQRKLDMKHSKEKQQTSTTPTSPLQRTPVRRIDDVNRKQADVSSPPKKAQRKVEIKHSKEKQHTPTIDTSAEKLGKPTTHNRGKNELEHLFEKPNFIPIPKRTKIKRDKKEKMFKNVASTKAAKPKKISSFFNKTDQPIVNKEKPGNIPKPSITVQQIQKNRKNYFHYRDLGLSGTN